MIEWRSIPGHEKYEASTNGTIRRLHSGHLRTLKTWKNWNGYHLLELRGKKIALHKAIALAFFGPCPLELECSHLDGNKDNNRPNNLKYVTRRENHAHKKLHGTYQLGENGPTAKLTDAKVCEIRKLAKEGKMTQRAIGKLFNVTESTISCIVLRRTWKHLFDNIDFPAGP